MARKKKEKEVYSISTTDKGMALRMYRLINGLSIYDLANDPDVPVTANTVSKYERNLYLDFPEKQKAFDEIFEKFIKTIRK